MSDQSADGDLPGPATPSRVPARLESSAASPECGADCQQALAELERFLDGELPNSEIGRVSEHLAACYPCTDRATFEEQLRAVVRRGCVDAAPADLVDRIRITLDEGMVRGGARPGD
jgi:mycothiol system anti-sigma-R factor